MLDPRVTRLAELLCTHSTELGPDDKLLIHAFDMPEEVVAEFVRVGRSKGAQTLVRSESNLVRRELMMGMTRENAGTIADVEKYEMERMTAYISLRGANNYAEMAGHARELEARYGQVSGSLLDLWYEKKALTSQTGHEIINRFDAIKAAKDANLRDLPLKPSGKVSRLTRPSLTAAKS